MAKITLQGNEIHTSGNLPEIGSRAPDFTLVNKDLEDVSLSTFPGKRKILCIVPSLDTPVCAVSAKKFDEYAKEYDDTVTLVISADLPFASSRFCLSENLEQVITLSVMRSQNFAKDYGVLIESGPLSGITARAIVVLDQKNSVIHTELISEIAHEPDYKAALLALGRMH
ncbi:MAG: thiol peroxidase [Gammaproteobacteria bacterium]|nr:thiol peroxidase [Gammaproteobacteria bacterium]